MNIKKLEIFFSNWRKNHEIKFVGNIDVKNWINFGHPVTSIVVENSQKLQNFKKWSSVIAEENGARNCSVF